MEFKKVLQNKKQYIDLLLLADEQESMVDKYLERGDMFALFDKGLKAICVVSNNGKDIYEIKNIATEPKYQGRGYGKAMIDYVCNYYQPVCEKMLVGTGDSPYTIPFYQKCGFMESYRVKNFFTDHYDHPIFEGGKQLVDMVYLEKKLR
ncbi:MULTISPECIES: GNAT family N-acetyltransferase [Bacillus]|uniref:GNAT family N-acetyltransferase n=1 Tax=Bacillus TaxID=1386 RepID=UPI0002F2292D|nr:MULTISPECIES: GNAT family N-acetyltransferase [Bacillus]